MENELKTVAIPRDVARVTNHYSIDIRLYFKNYHADIIADFKKKQNVEYILNFYHLILSIAQKSNTISVAATKHYNRQYCQYGRKKLIAEL